MPPRLYYDAKNPGLVTVDRPFYQRLGETTRRTRVETIVVPSGPAGVDPSARTALSHRGLEGPQVCDFNAWTSQSARAVLGGRRSRQFEGAHVTTASAVSCLPYLRPILTFTTTAAARADGRRGRCHDLLGSGATTYLYKLTECLRDST